MWIKKRDGERFLIKNLYHLYENDVLVAKAFYACKDVLFILPYEFGAKLSDVPKEYIDHQIRKLEDFYSD